MPIRVSASVLCTARDGLVSYFLVSYFPPSYFQLARVFATMHLHIALGIAISLCILCLLPLQVEDALFSKGGRM